MILIINQHYYTVFQTLLNSFTKTYNNKYPIYKYLGIYIECDFMDFTAYNIIFHVFKIFF
jgi:hypothetical protein